MKTESDSWSPRVYATLVATLGMVLAAGGVYLLILGGSSYYLLIGAALVVSGFWLWRGDERGLWSYAFVVLVTVTWALVEVGLNWVLLVPRIGLIALLALWLLLPLARRGLAWPKSRRRPRPLLAALAGVAAIGVAATLAPTIPPPTIADGTTGLTTPALEMIPVTAASSDWIGYGLDASGNRYVPAAQITPANVGRLKLAWSFRTGDIPTEPFSFEDSPLKVDGKLYVCTPTRQVIALGAATGEEIWRFKPPQDTLSRRFPLNCRGVSYHADQPHRADRREGALAPCSSRILVSSFKGELWALDAESGRPCSDFGSGGSISLLEGLGPMDQRDWVNTSPGVVVGDIIVLGGKVTDQKSAEMPSGVIRAFDVHSGRLVWAWDMGSPDRQGPPAPDEIYTQSTPNAWPPFAADPELSLVYVPTGNPAPDHFGGYRRSFDEKYGTAIVALDTHTGRPRWFFQTIHHDLWDQDLPAQPILADWPVGSGTRKALVQLSKAGDIFVLDRATGAPIVPVHEIPVPQHGGVPDDRHSATQPMSELTLAQRDVREQDMWGLTPIDQMVCRIAFRRARNEGRYTLPGLSQSLNQAIHAGVNDWSGGTIDPRNQILIASPRYLLWMSRQLPRANGDHRILSTSEQGLVEMAGTPYRHTSTQMKSLLGLPCNAPPWGELVGIDMRTSKLAWRDQLGMSVGGNVITGGGLSFIAATGDGKFRAFDVRTGKQLWRTKLAADGNATPISYMENGRQFIVIAAGGYAYAPSTKGDYVLAYTLDGTTKER